MFEFIAEWWASQFTDYFLGVCVREAIKREKERERMADICRRAMKPLRFTKQMRDEAD